MVRKNIKKRELEKETSLEKVRGFIIRYWKIITGVILIVLIGYSSFYAYNYFKDRRISRASEKYFEFESVLKEGFTKESVDEVKLEDIALELESDYSGTIYPGMAYFQLGNYYFSKADYKNSIEKFKKCVEITKDKDLIVSARWGVGDCLYEEGEYEEAIDTYIEIYNEFPDNDLIPFILLKLSYTYLETDNPEECGKYVTTIITNYPNSTVVAEAMELRNFVDRY